jgi:cytidylate kinase
VPVITIARQYGAGGEAVGQILAARLGAEYVDKQIVAEVARRLEMADDEIEEHDEAPGSLLSRLLASLGAASIEFTAPPETVAWKPPYQDPAFDPRRAVLMITQEVVREAARSGNAVIVGRGGAYILRDEPDTWHVFLRAQDDFRVRTARATFGMDEDEARRRIKQTDANRAAYVRQLYGHDWLHPSHYDLVLDTGRLGFERTAEAVLAAIGRSRSSQ